MRVAEQSIQVEQVTIPPRLLSMKHAAAYLGIAPCTLRRLAASGQIPRVAIGAAVRFDLQDLEAFIAASKSREGGDDGEHHQTA